MPKFNLANDWFGPDSQLHRKSHNPHNFTEDAIAVLPSKTTFAEGPNAGKTVAEVRGDPPPPAPVNMVDYAEMKLQNERLLNEVARLQGKEKAKEDPAIDPSKVAIVEPAPDAVTVVKKPPAVKEPLANPPAGERPANPDHIPDAPPEAPNPDTGLGGTAEKPTPDEPAPETKPKADDTPSKTTEPPKPATAPTPPKAK